MGSGEFTPLSYYLDVLVFLPIADFEPEKSDSYDEEEEMEILCDPEIQKDLQQAAQDIASGNVSLWDFPDQLNSSNVQNRSNKSSK